jgi:hypothetical protein
MIILCSVLLRMRNVSHKLVEKIKTHIFCSVWDNVEQYGGARQTTDDNMVHILACWVTKTTDSHSEYVMLIAFSLLQWLCEWTPLLCLYVHCLFLYYVWWLGLMLAASVLVDIIHIINCIPSLVLVSWGRFLSLCWHCYARGLSPNFVISVVFVSDW